MQMEALRAAQSADRRGSAWPAAMHAAPAARPAAVQPSASQPGAVQPSSLQTGAVRPSASQPGATQPSASQPGAAQPSALQPGLVQPPAPQPGAGQPVAPEPVLPAHSQVWQANLARLAGLGEILDQHGLRTRLITPPGRVPSLHVVNPQASALAEDVYAGRAQDGLWWFWWSWAERITLGEDLEGAASRIKRVLAAS
jgi:hypothetical protein